MSEIYIDYSAPYFIGYNGPLSEYTYHNIEYGNLLQFLNNITQKETIWLSDSLFYEDAIPPIGYDTYILCYMGEVLNRQLLAKIAEVHRSASLILLTTQIDSIPSYKVFHLEHLHTLVPFFNKSGTFKKLLDRKYTNSILTRRITPHKTKFTHLAQLHCDNLIYSYGSDNQIDTFDQWSLMSPAYADSKFHWSNETVFASSNAFPYITEKTFKPIASKTPFAIIGPAGAHQKLVDLGFYTYESLLGIWDNLDNVGRVEAITKAMQLVTDEFILDNVDTITEIIEHNYNHFIVAFANRVESSNKLIEQEIIEYIDGKK